MTRLVRGSSVVIGRDGSPVPGLLSIVIPAFNEEENIATAISRTGMLLDELGYRWEMVVVDDGSFDATFAILRQAAAGDKRIRVLRLSRNSGSHIAITAGLAHARGDACLVITADLEEPPEMIPAFVQKWQEGYEIVWGIRAKRNEPVATRLASWIFHTLFRLFGLPEYSQQAIGGGFFLTSRRVVNALSQIRERNRTLVGLLSWMGFSQGYIHYVPSSRQAGTSKWTLAKRIKLAIDCFASFSYVPIRAVSILGMSISVLSFVYGLVIILRALFGGVAVQGWPTLMVTVLFLGGIQLLVSGILGEYIWRALDEARARPLYIVSETVGFVPNDSAEARYLAATRDAVFPGKDR